jgi:chromosome segregation ATPase
MADDTTVDVDNITLRDSEDGGSGDEGVGSLVRHAVSELECALNESRKLLSEREQELSIMRRELDKYKQQAAKEILKKTEISAALDQSRTHALRLESFVERWQQELRESKAREEQAKHLVAEKDTDNERLRLALREQQDENEKLAVENSRLSSQIEEQRKTISSLECEQALSNPTRPRPGRQTRSPDPDINMKFLRKAIYHYLTGHHADEQVKLIVAILDFDTEQRKNIYDKLQQRGSWFHSGKA